MLHQVHKRAWCEEDIFSDVIIDIADTNSTQTHTHIYTEIEMLSYLHDICHWELQWCGG